MDLLFQNKMDYRAGSRSADNHLFEFTGEYLGFVKVAY